MAQQVVPVLSGVPQDHLLSPVGISRPCFSFTRFVVVQCLLKKNKYLTLPHSLKTTSTSVQILFVHVSPTIINKFCIVLYCIVMPWRIPFAPNYSTLEKSVFLLLRPIPRSQMILWHSSFSKKTQLKVFFCFFLVGGGGGRVFKIRTPWHNVPNGASQYT